MRFTQTCLLLALTLVVSGCASAGDRLNDGIELQAEGRWMEAAYRYADAVEKDETLAAARDRLMVAGDSAIQIAVRTASDFWSDGDPIRAADEFRSVDALLIRVREVGLRLTTPTEYGDLRRESFKWAIDALMSFGDRAAADGDFGDARSAFIRARSDYEATPEERASAFEAETGLLVAWAGSLLTDQRYQGAFSRAEEALQLRPSPRPSTVDAVRSIQSEALALGTVRLAVLPITSVAEVRESVGDGMGSRLGDDLELDYWREPPPFVAVVDPVRVRRQTREATRLDETLTPRALRRLLESVGAEYAALIEVSSVTVTEENTRTNGRSARTRDGRTTSYEVLSGRRVYDVQVSLVLVDDDGREFDSWSTSSREGGTFERGVYDGAIDELDLGRNERRLFNDDVQEAQRAEVESKVLARLAEKIADRVFDRVLSRVP